MFSSNPALFFCFSTYHIAHSLSLLSIVLAIVHVHKSVTARNGDTPVKIVKKKTGKKRHRLRTLFSKIQMQNALREILNSFKAVKSNPASHVPRLRPRAAAKQLHQCHQQPHLYVAIQGSAARPHPQSCAATGQSSGRRPGTVDPATVAAPHLQQQALQVRVSAWEQVAQGLRVHQHRWW